MSLLSNDSSVSSAGAILSITLAQKITFGFLIALILPSVASSCFVFYRVTQNKEIFKKLSNQLIFCLFLIYFIQAILDLPLTIKFLHRGEVAIPNYTFCTYWFTLMSTLNMCTMYLNAYLSIERYLLVFHNKFLLKYKNILHYIPMFLILIISVVFVFSFSVLYPCQTQFNYNAIVCGSVCSILIRDFGLFVWILTFVAPLFVIIFSNGFILTRVILHKRRMLQKNIWQKNKGMVLQLLSVTGMLYISWLPVSITTVIYTAHSTPLIREIHDNWLTLGLIYIPVLSSPLTTSFAIPELRNDIRVWLNRRRPHVNIMQTHPTIPAGT
ncbi:unnamed protein product [Adineta steineri]|uniref:G-protein coupled receptors family 1 profile domain-containing protein n=1 Tax=Adineta steineri TaxID=433720 RepID=A0A814NN95_9BILA|nr:unnamed protein product [Adineta steineri]CAF1533034.1 unnamed protein product [Adineta steineri]